MTHGEFISVGLGVGATELANRCAAELRAQDKKKGGKGKKSGI